MQNDNVIYIHKIEDIPKFIKKDTYLFFYDDNIGTITYEFLSYFPYKGLNKNGLAIVSHTGPPVEYSCCMITTKDIIINKEVKYNAE